jgi:PiT family inorganic phosphate transporter
MHNSLVLIVVVTAAVIFDFTNGFHDTANSIAPTVATGAMRPRTAVALSAVFNLVGAFLSLHVAQVIAKSIVSQGSVTLAVIFGGLIGAVAWNVTTWYHSIPSSSSHALIGGVVGAMLAHAGSHAVLWHGIASKVLIPSLVAPTLALGLAAIATITARRLTSKVPSGELSAGMRFGQIGSSSLLSLAHGTNDAQKTMGVITLALVANGSLVKSSNTPNWVVVVCALAIGLGTFIGGWRIIRTMGQGFTKMSSTQGFSAQMSAAAVILSSSHFGLPLSTTHVATGSILGSGVGTPGEPVRWRLAGRVGAAWLLTLPLAAVFGAVGYCGENIFGLTTGAVVMGAVVTLYCGAVYLKSRSGVINASNVNHAWDQQSESLEKDKASA